MSNANSSFVNANSDSMDTTKIIVAGCGPTGAMVSTLLSQYSVTHVVLERDEALNSDPRGIALDEDGIRCLQACGIYDKIFTEIGQCWSLPLLPLHDQHLAANQNIIISRHGTL